MPCGQPMGNSIPSVVTTAAQNRPQVVRVKRASDHGESTDAGVGRSVVKQPPAQGAETDSAGLLT